MGKVNQKIKELNWQTVGVDGWLAFAFVFLLVVGTVMVASSSVAVAEKNTGDAFYYLKRHAMFISLGLFFSYVVMHISSEWMDRLSRPMLILAVIALLLVLAPGIGVKVNGAQRWINLGIARFQVVEAVKLALIAALASYVVHHYKSIQRSMLGVLNNTLSKISLIFLNSLFIFVTSFPANRDLYVVSLFSK